MPGSKLKSVGAVVAGFLAVAILSTVVDVILHAAKVYPAWGVPMSGPLYGLALAYRVVFTVLGGWITARLAPANPMKHVVWLGIIGTIAGIGGVVTAWTHPELGPHWYPIAIAVTGFPCCWIGGKLAVRGAG